MSIIVYNSAEDAPYITHIQNEGHHYIADEPAENSGLDKGPTPTRMVLGALGACTCITLRMYAARKQWPLTRIEVSVDMPEADGKKWIERSLHLEGDLSAEQRERLLQIANVCPVHKMLSPGNDIRTTLT